MRKDSRVIFQECPCIRVPEKVYFQDNTRMHMQNRRHWTIRGGAEVGKQTISARIHPRILTAENRKGLLQLLRDLPSFPVCWDDFRRASDSVRGALLGAVTAYLDAEQNPNPESSILAWGHTGSLAENQRYFKDYQEFGTGRAHYFVGTLPTIPLCECSIALGLHGGGYYLDCSAEALTDEIDQLLEQPDAPPLLLILSRDDHQTVFLLEHGNTTEEEIALLKRAAGEIVS